MSGDFKKKRMILSLLTGIIVGTMSLLITVHLATAAPLSQTDDEDPLPMPEHPDAQACQECHLDVTNHWVDSAHANAFSDPYFQSQWTGLGEPTECLACHTTNFQPATGEYSSEGVECQACHGEVDAEHPPNPVPILADTEYCGTCHTTTLSEWHRTGHATEDIGCNDCHDPHSQEPLFEENPDELCINCHSDSMEDYLEDLHVQNDIGCVDCHALVIPPDPIPEDGIVPTGHAFDITPATCVACHTDALHAGFSLPGFEHGDMATAAGESGDGDGAEAVESEGETAAEENALLTPEQQIETLEAALASRNVTGLFQGGIVGLVLGGSSAWFVASNVRQNRRKEEEENGS